MFHCFKAFNFRIENHKECQKKSKKWKQSKNNSEFYLFVKLTAFHHFAQAPW